jgi:hypothetical protein
MITRGPVAPVAVVFRAGGTVVDDPRAAGGDEPEEHAAEAIATRIANTTIAPVDAA